MSRTELEVGDSMVVTGHVDEVHEDYVVMRLCVVSEGREHPLLRIDLTDDMVVTQAGLRVEPEDMARAIQEKVIDGLEKQFTEPEPQEGTGPGGTFVCAPHGWTGITRCPTCLVT